MTVEYLNLTVAFSEIIFKTCQTEIAEVFAKELKLKNVKVVGNLIIGEAIIGRNITIVQIIFEENSKV